MLKAFISQVIVMSLLASSCALAGHNPIPEGTYLGITPLPEDGKTFGEIEFTVQSNGVAAIRVANGRRVKRSNFDLNTLVPGTIPKQLRLDTDFSAFHPEGTEYPLIVVRSSLVSGQSPSSLLESIYIYPAESEKIPRTSLFSSAQVTSGVVENLIAAFVQRDGGFPRLKGGGRSFSECLLKMEMPAKVN